jgi:hypothetical protein
MNKLSLSFIILFLNISCKKGIINETLQKEEWKIKTVDNRIISIELQNFEDDSIKLLIPKYWKIERNTNSWKYFPYNNKNPKLYFAISKYDSSKIEMEMQEYLREGIKQVSEKIDTFRYILKKLTFKNRKSGYILTLFTSEKGIDYVTYSLIYKDEKIIFDFAFKTLNDGKVNEVNYRKFLLITQNFEFNNKRILDGEKLVIEKEKEIKLENL